MHCHRRAFILAMYRVALAKQMDINTLFGKPKKYQRVSQYSSSGKAIRILVWYYERLTSRLSTVQMLAVYPRTLIGRHSPLEDDLTCPINLSFWGRPLDTSVIVCHSGRKMVFRNLWSGFLRRCFRLRGRILSLRSHSEVRRGEERCDGS